MLPKYPLQRKELYGAQGRLLREQHERKIHLMCAAVEAHIKLVGAVPAESVPVAQYNGHELQTKSLQCVTTRSTAKRTLLEKRFYLVITNLW